MNADANLRDSARVDIPSAPPSAPTLAAGASVVLLRPRTLRGTIGIVRRPMTRGWEVEIRSAEGTPMHLTSAERDLHLR